LLQNLFQILLLVCIGPVGYFLDNSSDSDFDKIDNLKFFVGAAAAAAVIVLLFFLIFLTGLHKKIDAFNWAKTVRIPIKSFEELV
jgi:uncharacterized membrane protein YbhN (UPF0104 family)